MAHNPSTGSRLIVRADSGRQRGYGHVIRSLTLGSEFVSRDWSVELLGYDLDDFLKEKALLCGIRTTPMSCEVGSLTDAQMTCATNPDLIVIDGYDFRPAYLNYLDMTGIPYVVIDDNGEVVAPGALLTINQNPHAQIGLYPGLDKSRVLLGSSYALIRSEVRCIRDARRRDNGASQTRVLVSVGGTDIRNLNYSMAEAISQTLHVTVEVSHANPPPGLMKAPRDIARSLANAHVAVIGAGSTLWEACFLGTPTVAVVVADNQVGASRAAHALGVCELVDCRHEFDIEEIAGLSRRLLESPTRRMKLSENGRGLIDGIGARRIVEFILSLLSGLHLNSR
jgi:spore coat polysaccharide biosynthesis predicted glycosyltransferase SpsG